jgi:lipoprotein NlpD
MMPLRIDKMICKIFITNCLLQFLGFTFATLLTKESLALQYKVQDGDNLHSIAKKYGINIDILLKENKQLSPDRPLYKNLIINIPSNEKYDIIVSKGDTIFSIAKKYNINTDDLMKSNNLKDHSIKIGQKLTIKKINTQNIPIEETIKKPVESSSNKNTIDKDEQTSPKEHENINQEIITVKQKQYIKNNNKPESTNNIPFIWPAKGNILVQFGQKHSGEKTEGIIMSVEEGSLIRASASGKVAFVGSVKGLGNVIILKHDYDFITAYGYNSEILITVGSRVKKGQVIAYSGNNMGKSVLYFSIRKNGISYDPSKIITQK